MFTVAQELTVEEIKFRTWIQARLFIGDLRITKQTLSSRR